jgi:hypothetical protein
VDRRRFLRDAAVAAGALGTSALLGTSCDPSDEAPPAAGSGPATARAGTISGRHTFDTLQIRRGERLVLNPERDTLIELSGNLVNEGLLQMRPSRGVQHTIRFVGVDESAFAGEGLNPIPSDVGLWVMGEGRLDAVGSPRLAWTRAAGTIPRGADAVELRERPRGWRVGDEVVITPTEHPSASATAYDRFEEFTITAITGNVVQLSGATRWEHPAVELPGGATFPAEVLNLTRNVVIEGTPQGNSHVFTRSTVPQTMTHVALRHMGPRKDGDKIAGRWPTHFHHCRDGSRGSIVDGVVVRDAGSHAFVAHMSHGVSFRNCIAYRTREVAYWWDELTQTNDVLYDGCVAARSIPGGGASSPGGDVFGFALYSGRNMVIRNCVAVGMPPGRVHAAGYQWPGGPDGGLWTSEDCVAHNCGRSGLFFWPNSAVRHLVKRFAVYNNHIQGTEHGAYLNAARYHDTIFFGNGVAQAVMKASGTGNRNPRQEWRRNVFDAAGHAANALVIGHHVAPAGSPILVLGGELRGSTDRPVLVDDTPGPRAQPTMVDFVEVLVDGVRDLAPDDFERRTMIEGGIIRVQRRDGRAFSLDHDGTVRDIGRFHL